MILHDHMDRKQRHARLNMSEGDRSKQPAIDYMRPIVADADTGYVKTSTTCSQIPDADIVRPFSVVTQARRDHRGDEAHEAVRRVGSRR